MVWYGVVLCSVRERSQNLFFLGGGEWEGELMRNWGVPKPIGGIRGVFEKYKLSQSIIIR